LFSNLTNAEYDGTSNTDGVSTFNADGFTLLNGVNVSNYNASGSTYVGWQWKANGAGSSNTQGTITSTVSANTTAGFSIVTYTGDGNNNATVGHGLGVTPSMIIIKRRSVSGDWIVYQASLSSPTDNYLILNATNAATNASGIFSISSTTFGFPTTYNGTNQSGTTYVAYCFAAVAGYSTFGSYTGNGSSDGPFIYTGFRPRFVMIKMSSSTSSWQIKDTARNPYNLADLTLRPNSSDAESSLYWLYDILSNGFKARTTDNEVNTNGGTYVWAAFAENPFKYSLAR
jgi:hypothetical protein